MRLVKLTICYNFLFLISINFDNKLTKGALIFTYKLIAMSNNNVVSVSLTEGHKLHVPLVLRGGIRGSKNHNAAKKRVKKLHLKLLKYVPDQLERPCRDL